MQKSLVQIFNETAAEAAEAYPQELGRLAVVVGSDIAYAAKQLADDTAALSKDIEGVKRRLAEREAASYTHNNYELAGEFFNLIALLDPEKIEGDFSARDTKEMQAIFILDYQLSRHIIDSARGISRNKAESACDAFATLRHIQRFGKDTDHARNRSQSTASSLILFTDTAHYTMNATQRALEVANELGTNFFKLTLQETVALAAKIANETYVNFREIRKLTKAFRPVAENCAARLGERRDIFRKFDNNDPEALAIMSQETLAVMRQHQNDPAIFTAGKQFLGMPAIKEFMTAQAAAGARFWQESLTFINTREPPTRKKRFTIPGLKR